MKKIIWILSIVLILVGCNNGFEENSNNEKGKLDEHQDHAHENIETYYTCSMHPTVKEDKPGKCPICHMNLTKIEIDKSEDIVSDITASPKEIWYCESDPSVTSVSKDICPIDGTQMLKKETGNSAAEIVAKVKLRKAQLDHFFPDFFPATKMKMEKNVRLLGSVLQSEDRESSIPARIGGRIEKVYVKSTGSFVKIGDPVLDLYSPKLITAGEEYLLAKQTYKNNKSREFKEMLEQSRERLKLWGMKEFQLDAWFKSGHVPKKITIYSPATGIVRKRNAVVGKYFKEGQNFFELSDLSEVWVEMDVYEQDAALVELGQTVEMEFTSMPGVKVNGAIDFVNPVLDIKSRTLKVRTTIKNENGNLKPGMIADATLNISFDGMPLVVPRSAIIDTGKRKVVWVKISNKQFQAKVIHAGHESEGYVEIKHGLRVGEEVVIEGSFLLDAQAQLFGGYEDMKKDPNAGHNH